MPKLCGAKNRQGLPCRRTGEANGRCHYHGGKTPKGQRNAWKHGFYSSALRADERQLFAAAPVGSLDDEVRLMRVKLYRLVKLSGKKDVADLVDSALEVAQRHDVHPRFGDIEKREIRVKAPQYAELIIAGLEQLRKLEFTRFQLAGGLPLDPDDEDGPVTRVIVEVVGARASPDDDGTAGAVRPAS
ncbi:MAG: hypothetical protein ACREUG_09235 [Steroidobacteraceae bacterium]